MGMIVGAIPRDLRGRVMGVLVATRSIPKTVMGILGLDEEPFDGVDLIDVAGGGEVEPVFSEGSHAFGVDARKRAVLEGQWKLIHRLAGNGYDLEDGSGERHHRWDFVWRSPKLP